MAWWYYFVAGIVVIAVGRLHFLFRHKVDGVDLGATAFSFWLRLGSVLVGDVLMLIALVKLIALGHL